MYLATGCFALVVEKSVWAEEIVVKVKVHYWAEIPPGSIHPDQQACDGLTTNPNCTPVGGHHSQLGSK